MKQETLTQNLSWKTFQDELAAENGLAIVVVEGAESRVVSESNDNSICRNLYSSAEFAPHCDEYCGKAFEYASQAGKTVHIKCHADLNFMATPIEIEDKKLVAITGRTFIKSEDYRRATERAISGDWQQFSPEDFFSNVLIAGSVQDLQPLARRIENLREEEKIALLKVGNCNANPCGEAQKGIFNQTEAANNSSFDLSKIPARQTSGNLNAKQPEKLSEVKKAAVKQVRSDREIAEYGKWRSILGSLLDLNYSDACESVLKFLQMRFKFSNLAWFARRDYLLEVIQATGTLQDQQMQIDIEADDERLLEAVKNETSLELRERSENDLKQERIIHLFPVGIGDQILGALMVGDLITDEKVKRHLARFARSVASEMEILRLRQKIEKQEQIQSAVRKFNQSLKKIDGEDVWEFLAQTSAEIMQAERGSLLAFDEAADVFTLKAAIGRNADTINSERKSLGNKIARDVLQQGAPLLVKNIRASGIPAAPEKWNYKTDSFISYPIILNDRKIGVFNISDKADGTSYNEFDLQVLNTIAPQLAVALDHTTLKRKAGEFEMLSITDPLTGLLNRRYLEERLAEEIKRWQRAGSPVSFLMIDVDEFKSYNDEFSHPEGDKALKLVGHALKATLRGADVAARYGGEEFSILLPQTALSEAVTIAERIRERVENTNFPNRPVTISIGISAAAPGISTVNDLISAADKALYEAKRAGRNNVQVFKRNDNH
ncbi:MAG: diguanylate cyclase [Pyrinomonadaceae bacterium]